MKTYHLHAQRICLFYSFYQSRPTKIMADSIMCNVHAVMLDSAGPMVVFTPMVCPIALYGGFSSVYKTPRRYQVELLAILV